MSAKHTTLTLCAFAAAALVAGGAWFLSGSGGQTGAGQVDVARPQSGAANSQRAAAEPKTTTLREVEAAPSYDTGRDVMTTVAWPIEVELELVRPSGLPQADDLPPMGSGRRARIRGRMTGAGDRGQSAVLTFVAGLNAGRVLHANEEGYFGATDLYPGIQLIRVDSAGVQGSLREQRLVAGKETRFDLSYGLPGSLGGRVFGMSGDPLEGVDVELDGVRTTTDSEGVFNLSGLSGGTNLVLLLRKQGYATHYSRIGVSAGRAIPSSQHSFRLERATSLQVSVPMRAGAAGPAILVITPADTNAAIDFAWHTVSPTEVVPGSSVVIDGLPAQRVSVRVYHRGALASPAEKIAILRPGHQERLEFELAPANVLKGRVIDQEGLAVRDAEVRLEAPDLVATGAMHLREMPHVFDTAYFSPLPPSSQSTRTDRDGNYLLTAWSEGSSGRYLVAKSEDGKLGAARVVRSGDERVDLVLEPQDQGSGRLLLDFPGRTQGLPVVVTLSGERRPEVVLEVSEVLPVEGLAPGTWRISARWHGQVLYAGEGHQELELEDEHTHVVPVPPGAVRGQDADTLMRAGRTP